MQSLNSREHVLRCPKLRKVILLQVDELGGVCNLQGPNVRGLWYREWGRALSVGHERMEKKMHTTALGFKKLWNCTYNGN